MPELLHFNSIFVGSNSLPQHPQQIPRGMMSQMPSQQQQPPAPPSYNMPNANRPQRWGMMPPQSQRQPYIPQNSVNTTQSSALKAQLTQPPSIVTAGVLNQYGQSKLCLVWHFFGFKKSF